MYVSYSKVVIHVMTWDLKSESSDLVRDYVNACTGYFLTNPFTLPQSRFRNGQVMNINNRKKYT